jgi:hypothetical protein
MLPAIFLPEGIGGAIFGGVTIPLFLDAFLIANIWAYSNCFFFWWLVCAGLGLILMLWFLVCKGLEKVRGRSGSNEWNSENVSNHSMGSIGSQGLSSLSSHSLGSGKLLKLQ